jgi:hypothetical protein
MSPDPDTILAFTFAFSALFVGARILMPIARAFAKRMENRAEAPRFPADVTSRLERMEQAIDSIAVEVERISEAQRFTTKLLSDKTRSYSEHPE